MNCTSMWFTIDCKDQDEVDYYWSRLTDGGEESQCGWCKDRFGLSWQVIPGRLYDLVSHPDPACATAATQAMYGMSKYVRKHARRCADGRRISAADPTSCLGRADGADRRPDRGSVVGGASGL